MLVGSPEELLRKLFDRAVEVADPIQSLSQHLPRRPNGRVVVIGAGKASARMAEAVEAAWGPCEGLVITRYGYGRPCKNIKIIEASHPIPDNNGLNATIQMLDLVENLSKDDFVLALISGGASSLLVAPVNGISLDDKKNLTSALLASGAPIIDINTVRKHLSAVKGGQLAAKAYPATMLSLMISDVPGDELAFIGSGPTVGESTSPQDALHILNNWKIETPNAVVKSLTAGSNVVPPDDVRLTRVKNRIYAGPQQSLLAAEQLAKSYTIDVVQLGSSVEGEARDVAIDQARKALKIRAERKAGDPPILLLSGGELTVTKRGNGIGGPNSEFCLSLAIELNGVDGIYAIACDTDGVDGAAEVAGAIVGPETLVKAAERGLNGLDFLQRNDAHSFFKAIGSQVVTGPTLTNVNDFRGILILGFAHEVQRG